MRPAVPSPIGARFPCPSGPRRRPSPYPRDEADRQPTAGGSRPGRPSAVEATIATAWARGIAPGRFPNAQRGCGNRQTMSYCSCCPRCQRPSGKGGRRCFDPTLAISDPRIRFCGAQGNGRARGGRPPRFSNRPGRGRPARQAGPDHPRRSVRGLHGRSGRPPARHQLSKIRDRALGRRQPGGPAQPARRAPAGSVVQRRRARPCGRRQQGRRDHLDAIETTRDHALYRRLVPRATDRG